jgi:hypothetical protein
MENNRLPNKANTIELSAGDMLGDMTGEGWTIDEIRITLKDLGINRKESDTNPIRYLRNSQV